jgi:excisionase family DNA binding protein
MSAIEIPRDRFGLPALLTVEDLAKLLRVSVRTVWRLRRNACLPHPVKIGGGVRWRISDVKAWIEQDCKPSTSAREASARRE